MFYTKLPSGAIDFQWGSLWGRFYSSLILGYRWLNTDYWLGPLPHGLAFRKSFLKLSVSHFIAVSTCCSIRYLCLPSCENCLFFFIFIFDFLLFNLLCKILLTIYNTKLNRLKNWYSTSLQLSLTKYYFTIPTHHSALHTPYANMANHSVVVWNELYESEASWASVFCFDKLPQKILASLAI